MDNSVANYFSLNRTEDTTEFFYLLTTIFDLSIHFALIVLCTAVLIYLFRGLRQSVVFISSIFAGGVIVVLLKSIFGIDRPAEGIIEVVGKSFPSGHATIATIFFVMLMHAFDKGLGGYKKIVFNFFSILLMLFVSLSRLYLGVHWLSDALFGILLGLLISWAAIYIADNVRVK